MKQTRRPNKICVALPSATSTSAPVSTIFSNMTTISNHQHAGSYCMYRPPYLFFIRRCRSNVLMSAGWCPVVGKSEPARFARTRIASERTGMPTT